MATQEESHRGAFDRISEAVAAVDQLKRDICALFGIEVGGGSDAPEIGTPSWFEERADYYAQAREHATGLSAHLEPLVPKSREVEVALLVLFDSVHSDMLSFAFAELPAVVEPERLRPHLGELLRLSRLLHAACDCDAQARREGASKRRKRRSTESGLTREEVALGLLAANRSMTVQQLAERLGVSRTTPYRWTRLKEVLDTRDRAATGRVPRGWKSGEPEGGRVEAIDPADED